MWGRSSNTPRPSQNPVTGGPNQRGIPGPPPTRTVSASSTSTGSHTVTIDELIQLEPTLRIRLRDRVQQSANRGQQVNFQQLLEYIFKRSNETIQADVASGRTTEENVARLHRIFQQFKDIVNQYEAEVLKDFDKLSPEQQDQVVAQYEEATAFIGDLFEWLDKVFDYAVAKVRAGFSIERDAVKKLFGKVRDELNKLF